MPTISLCVIARDAAPSLPDCIQSAEGLVNEVIVLDSGRLNGAGEWAVSNGAKMIPYQWTGDLSEARTASVRHATGDWVLVMDADEQLAPGSKETLREAVQSGGMDCAFLPIVHIERAQADSFSLTEADESTFMRTPRLLRRTIDLRWDSEDSESVNGWIAMRARRVRSIDAAIIKSDASVDSSIGKQEAEAPAMTDTVHPEQEVFVAPNSTVHVPASPVLGATSDMLERAWSCYHGNDLVGARAAIEQVWSVLKSDDPNAIQAVTLRAHIQVLDAEPKAALESIGRALDWGIHHPNLDMIQGVIAENTGMRSNDSAHQKTCLERAEAAFQACISYPAAVSARDSLPGVTTWAANTRLGTVRLTLGDIEGARAAFGAALEADPEHAEATLGMIEVYVETGVGASTLETLMPYMEANIADAWMLAAAACEEMGRVEDALLFVGRAHELVEDGLQVSAHRSMRMTDLLSMAGLYVGKPIAGPGPWGAIASIAARQPLPGNAIARSVDGPKTVRVVTHCLATGWTDIVEALLEPRAEQVAPGISDVVRRTLQAHGADAVDDGQPSPIFVGGAWDSGVRALQSMLDGHHRLEAGEATKLIPIMCSLRNDWWNGMAPDLEAAGVGEKQLDAAVAAFIQTLMGASTVSSELRQVETTPHTLLHMDIVARLFPKGRFIHVVRDGRDVVSSLLQRDWIDPATGDKVWCCKDIESAADYWVHVVDAIRAHGENVPGRYLEVQYEDLVSHPEAVIRQVLAFLGESWDPAVLEDVAFESKVSSTDVENVGKILDSIHTTQIVEQDISYAGK
jgi:protein-tyrosine sulfotransferase